VVGLIVLVAALDESNQSFNAARSASYADVILDICGGLAALAFILVIARFRRN
jgi:VanZ family protein